jgi:hypothetical protein
MADRSHRLRALLGRTTLAFTLGSVPSALAMAQGAACDAMAQPALNLRDFRQAVDAYADLMSRPEAASALLVCLRRSNRKLAETLMLHQSRLRAAVRSDAAVESAFLHYVINTSDPRLDEKEAAGLERLARIYRQSLLLAAEPDAAEASCDVSAWTLSRLRCIGQTANRRRYGRSDVVPVELLDFDSSSGGYSTRDATWMSEMSALAYWGPELIGRQLGRWGFARIAELADAATDTSGFIATRDRVLVLTFRGTSRARWAPSGADHGRTGPARGATVASATRTSWPTATGGSERRAFRT